MAPRIRIANRQARRIFLDRHALLEPVQGTGRGVDLAALVDRLGFVQLDSINTLNRAHDLILWSRQGRFRPPALGRLLARDRKIFEHWTHDAAILPIASFPFWRHRFSQDEAVLRKRWRAWRRDGFEDQIDTVYRQIAENGPQCSSDVGKDEARGSGGWWDWHPSKTALEFLWRTGRLSVCHREGFQKYFDLTERVIPQKFLEKTVTWDETIDWACRSAIHRLGFATPAQISEFWEMVPKLEVRRWCAEAVAAGTLHDVLVEGADGTEKPMLAPRELLSRDLPDPTGRVRVLSPFDPALRNRDRAEWLFGFSYRIEIFVPAAKREYGYYVFPVLERDRLIGRIDMRADRTTSTLNVAGFWPEVSVKMSKGRRDRLQSEIVRAARFSGSDRIVFAEGWLRSP